MRIIGEKNTTHTGLNVKGGLTLEDCRGIALRNCQFVGGYCNLYLLNCTGVTIVDCECIDPRGTSDADGNGPHNVLFDGCTNCAIILVKIRRTPTSEMGIGFYKSNKCIADGCTIEGASERQSADAITFDWGSKNCTASNNKIDLRNARKTKPMGHSAIVVAAGAGHRIIMGTGWIQGSCEDYPIAVTSYYDKAGNPVDDADPKALRVSATVRGFERGMVYVGPRATVKFLKA